MENYKIDHDEVWEVRAGGAWAIKHSALERVAAENKINFEPPAVIESSSADKTVALLITAHMGDRMEWTFGEASPANNKNAYCYAMAEKRGKDRCILKLLKAHGVVYSESEADEFTQGAKATQLPKKDSKDIYTKLQSDIDNAVSREQLKAWGNANAERIALLADDWQDILRLRFEEKMADLRQMEAA